MLVFRHHKLGHTAVHSTDISQDASANDLHNVTPNMRVNLALNHAHSNTMTTISSAAAPNGCGVPTPSDMRCGVTNTEHRTCNVSSSRMYNGAHRKHNPTIRMMQVATTIMARARTQSLLTDFQHHTVGITVRGTHLEDGSRPHTVRLMRSISISDWCVSIQLFKDSRSTSLLAGSDTWVLSERHTEHLPNMRRRICSPEDPTPQRQCAWLLSTTSWKVKSRRKCWKLMMMKRRKVN